MRTVCAHFIPIEEECSRCDEASVPFRVQMLERRLDDVQNMLNNRNNELSNALEEIANLNKRIDILTSFHHGSNI